MQNRHIYYSQVLARFYDDLKQDSLLAVYTLGGLYAQSKDPTLSQCPKLKKTIRLIRTQFNTESMGVLCAGLLNMSDEMKAIENPHDAADRHLLTQIILTDQRYYKAISRQDLLHFGQDPAFYRFVMIALIRNHLHSAGLKDPFEDRSFNIKALENGNADQNYLYVSRWIKQCAALPQADLIALGRTEQIARWIWLDLSQHRDRFSVGEAFGVAHPALKAMVEQDRQSAIAQQAKRKASRNAMRAQENASEHWLEQLASGLLFAGAAVGVAYTGYYHPALLRFAVPAANTLAATAALAFETVDQVSRFRI